VADASSEAQEGNVLPHRGASVDRAWMGADTRP
jgi:hypothetical protein